MDDENPYATSCDEDLYSSPDEEENPRNEALGLVAIVMCFIENGIAFVLTWALLAVAWTLVAGDEASPLIAGVTLITLSFLIVFKFGKRL